MDYLFTKQDTMLALCLFVYSAWAFIQLQKAMVLRQLGAAVSVRESFSLVFKIVSVVPLFWTVKLLM